MDEAREGFRHALKTSVTNIQIYHYAILGGALTHAGYLANVRENLKCSFQVEVGRDANMALILTLYYLAQLFLAAARTQKTWRGDDQSPRPDGGQLTRADDLRLAWSSR